MSGDLLGYLQERGYWPDDDPHHDGWYDLAIAGAGTVRLCMDSYDGEPVSVYAFNAHMALRWEAQFSGPVPAGAIIGALSAAEAEIAEPRDSG